MTSRALVLFSGGQDSATCVAWALEKFDHVETIGFDYGQRHSVELECRRHVLKALAQAKLGDDHMVDLKNLAALGDTAMTKDVEITFAENGLPTTFVPGRNLLFFTYAAALAYRRGITHVVGGMCETDYSGYPDCRDATIKALNKALNMGMDKSFELHTPLMWLDKAATWGLAEKIGGMPLVELIRTETHSCYKGDRSRLHEWGYGCDACPACELRKKGFVKYRAA